MHAVARAWNQLEKILLTGMPLATFSHVVFNNLYGVFYSLAMAMFGGLIFVGLAWGVRSWPLLLGLVLMVVILSRP